jgi:dienelactone hydrolase
LGWTTGLVPAKADGPKDNLPGQVRPIPPPGVDVSAADRTELEQGLKSLGQAIEQLRKSKDARVQELIPDVEIYRKAVSDALAYREFFVAKDVDKAKKLLKDGLARAEQLAAGKSPWTTQTGLVARGYVSRIDGSVQPYGLVVPESYTNQSASGYRLDLWFHGRGETVSEVAFIDQRQTQRGQFAPADTLVLHPYGRYCNANRFAGEVDVFEALESVKRRYRVDVDRTSVRGFSMGGAACWQFATHYPDRWFAANPGAGFSETAEFLRVFQSESLAPAWYEQALWHMYDSTDYAANLFHCPTVAYSGEIDGQKQAADAMAAALDKEGIRLMHIIGPKTKHQYHPDSALEVERRLASIAEHGRERVQRTLHFTTYTLRYNQLGWVTLTGLGEHWKQAHVRGQLGNDHQLALDTENVTDLTLEFPAGWCPLGLERSIHITIDGQDVVGPRPASDRSWSCPIWHDGKEWKQGLRTEAGLRKRPNLQGPIDDAFMDSFVFVRPSKPCASPQVDAWVKAELERAIFEWRRQFRGQARVKLDKDITDADIAGSNLVLWGDPTANSLLARVAGQLPISWTKDQVEAGPQTFDAAHHAPVFVYPNPLNPARYVVVNSSFTYREYDYLNNARQTSKLPDWAVIDLRTPPDSRTPGKIVAADFFGEQWQLRPPRQ